MNTWLEEVKTKPVAAGEQVEEYQGRIFRSAYDRAAVKGPVWVCDHRHWHPDEARQCAQDALDRGVLGG